MKILIVILIAILAFVLAWLLASLITWTNPFSMIGIIHRTFNNDVEDSYDLEDDDDDELMDDWTKYYG